MIFVNFKINMNQIVLQSISILLFILVILLVPYIIPGIFTQDLSTIKDEAEKIAATVQETVDNKI